MLSVRCAAQQLPGWHCTHDPALTWDGVSTSPACSTNGLAALVLAAALPWARGEHAVLRAAPWDGRQTGVLLLSCLVGLCLSHATFQLRSSVSATTVGGVVTAKGWRKRVPWHAARPLKHRPQQLAQAGLLLLARPPTHLCTTLHTLTAVGAATLPQASVVGVVCKLLTVLYSMVIWGRQVSVVGMACLAVSIACGALYQQAPLRQQFPASQQDGKRGASAAQQQRQRVQQLQQQRSLAAPLLGGLRPASGKEGVHHVSSSAALSRSASMTWRPMDPGGGSNMLAVVSLHDEEDSRTGQVDGPSPVYVTIVGLDKPASKR